MITKLDFTLTEFLAGSTKERIAHVRRLAKHAAELALDPSKSEVPYARIAQEWNALADAMERLLAAKQVVVRTDGPPSHRRSYLALAERLL